MKSHFISDVLQKTKTFIISHKLLSSGVALVTLLAVVLSCVFVGNNKDNNKVSSLDTIFSSSQVSSSQSSSQIEVSSETVSDDSSSKNSQSSTASKKEDKTSSVAASTKPSGGYNYNTNLNIEDNVFMDALIYTGYNMKKHRADGNMWKYILASRKRGLGYLSKISFGGGSSGYETTKDGKPDLKAFERGGLVCASFVTYVYFNYLPNVAGIDTSPLTRPDRSYNANSWYTAAKDWVKKGYSRHVKFTAKRTAAGIDFALAEDIPIGSIICFRNDDEPNSKSAAHVVVYAGKKNGYHWVYHTGNKNGPEMCAVERMIFGPDPQWPIDVITTPSNIRMSAKLEVEVKDNENNPLPNVEVKIKNSAGKTISLGKTNVKGIVAKEGLSYGKYTLIQTLPSGYKGTANQNINLTTANNSYNKVSLVNTKEVIQSSSDNQSQEE